MGDKNDNSEYKRNLAMNYAMRNECVEIKHKTIKVLQSKFEELAELSKSQCGAESLETLKALAEIGKAIMSS